MDVRRWTFVSPVHDTNRATDGHTRARELRSQSLLADVWHYEVSGPVCGVPPRDHLEHIRIDVGRHYRLLRPAECSNFDRDYFSVVPRNERHGRSNWGAVGLVNGCPTRLPSLSADRSPRIDVEHDGAMFGMHQTALGDTRAEVIDQGASVHLIPGRVPTCVKQRMGIPSFPPAPLQVVLEGFHCARTRSRGAAIGTTTRRTVDSGLFPHASRCPGNG